MEARTFRTGDEVGRVSALHRLDPTRTGPGRDFDDVLHLVQRVLDMPYAAVNMIDTDRQVTLRSAGIEVSDCNRSDAFCDITIRHAAPLAVEDAAHDPRFAANPFVTGAPGLRSYIGAPLVTPDGYPVGTVCAFAPAPRRFGDDDREVMARAAGIVMTCIELRQIAALDALTGALSRRAFVHSLDRHAAEATEATLMMIDVDHFKAINDTHGHLTGDKVLQALARCIMGQMGGGELLGRLGGEEFAVLVPARPAPEARALAETLCAAVSDQVAIDGQDGPVTVSIGTATRSSSATVEWLHRADQALYRAKRGGRNRVVHAD